MDYSKIRRRLSSGDDGFTVVMGKLDLLPDLELEERCKKLSNAIDAFSSVICFLEGVEKKIVIEKISALQKRLRRCLIETERRQQDLKLVEQ